MVCQALFCKAPSVFQQDMSDSDEEEEKSDSSDSDEDDETSGSTDSDDDDDEVNLDHLLQRRLHF